MQTWVLIRTSNGELVSGSHIGTPGTTKRWPSTSSSRVETYPTKAAAEYVIKRSGWGGLVRVAAAKVELIE